MISRNIFSKIEPFLDKNINLLFLGSRQVGKTVLLHLIQDELLKRQIARKEHIFFFDLEKGNDLNIIATRDPEQFVDYLLTKNKLPSSSPLFIFIDEIQYLPHASSFLKILADHFPHARLFLSGSSSLEIKKIFSDRLTGRKVSFHLHTLSFPEYLLFQDHPLAHLLQKISVEDVVAGNIASLVKLKDFLPELSPAYEEFVLFGGYPKPSLKENRSIRVELLAEIRDQYARRDVSDILQIENVTGFNHLLTLLATQIGNLVNVDELANSANLNRQTVEKYLFLLEETFIVKRLRPHFTNRRKELIKMPKVYFQDTGLRNLLIDSLLTQPLDLRPDKGSLVENAIFHELSFLEGDIHFWRTKTKSEVDFVFSIPNVGIIPMEVKYQPMEKPTLPSGLAAFIKKYHPHHAFVATKDFLGKTSLENTHIYFVPTLFF